MTLPGTIRPLSTTGTSLIAPTARIAASGGLMIAVNSSTPNMPRFEIEKVAPLRSPSPGRPDRARSITCRESIEIWIRSLMSASCTTGTSRPMPWLGATTSTSGPLGRSAVGCGLRRSDLGRLPPAAITSSLTMRPSGPDPFSDARSTPISAARRLASGEALTPSCCWPSSPPRSRGVGCEAAGGASGAVCFGAADFCAGSRSSATCAVGSGSFGLDPAAPSFFGGASFAAGSAPASPIFATGAPILAGTPCSTRICSVPSASASRSNVALSDSTSARTSPVFTSSPLFFFHSTMVPSSILSDSFGILMSGIYLSPAGEQRRLPGRRPGRLCRRRDERKPSGFPLIFFMSGIGLPAEAYADQALDVLACRDRRLFQAEAVRHRHLRAAQPANRRIEVVEAPLLHAGGELGGHAVRRPTLLDDHAAARLAHRVHDGLPVDGTDRAQVDNLGV